MPRASRYFIPGHVWHITHRCHQREFLFKFSRDRQCWLKWLHEAKKRYGLDILAYTVTSNHIHLLVFDNKRQVIPQSVQLVAGRSAQQYNQRKGRRGAFWEDRYHATAVESGEHLARCLVYIDLNMVRAGVVSHPAKWQESSYNEIQQSPRRYRLINRDKLKELLGIETDVAITAYHREWVEERIKEASPSREPDWTHAIAVGGDGYINNVCELLEQKNQNRVVEPSRAQVINEPAFSYATVSNGDFSVGCDNRLYWEDVL